MLVLQFQESENNSITIHGFSPSTFRSLLNYVYTENLHIGPITACEIFNLLMFLECSTTLLRFTTDYILQNLRQIPADDLLQIICMCEHRDDVQYILTPAMDCLASKFLELACTDTFMDHLPPHILIHIIKTEAIENDSTTEEKVSIPLTY